MVISDRTSGRNGCLYSLVEHEILRSPNLLYDAKIASINLVLRDGQY